MIPLTNTLLYKDVLRDFNDDSFNYQRNISEKEIGLREYVIRKLQKNPEIKKIHLVLQSAPDAEKYFYKYYSEVKKILSYDNSEHKDAEYEIKSITSSNYYSLVSFLFASDFPE